MVSSAQIKPTKAELRRSKNQLVRKMLRLTAEERELFFRVIEEINTRPESERDAEIFGDLFVRYAPEYGIDAEQVRRFQQRTKAE